MDLLYLPFITYNIATKSAYIMLVKLQLNKIAARWPAKAVAQLSFSQ